ncbi:GTPase [Limimaricola variabilis]
MSDRPTDTDSAAPPMPVLWLLGKTGAGKSSLVRALTGVEAVEIGTGFAPCTRGIASFDFPPDRPLMRFLDTRGLGEAGYDAAEDLARCEAQAHVVLAMARLDDPAQGDLESVLRDLRRRRPDLRVIVLHMAAAELADAAARARARSAMQRRLERAAGGPLPWVEMSLGRDETAGLDALCELLGETMPAVALLLGGRSGGDGFSEVRAEVLRYAGAAAAADLAPVLGAVGVPGLQAAMLRALARHHRVDWTGARAAEFAAALGLGAALRLGAGYVIRQAAKLVPVAGQTLGAAAAGAASFATTYALGRAAHRWLAGEALGTPVPEAELRALYRDALARAGRR